MRENGFANEEASRCPWRWSSSSTYSQVLAVNAKIASLDGQRVRIKLWIGCCGSGGFLWACRHVDLLSTNEAETWTEYINRFNDETRVGSLVSIMFSYAQ